MAIQPSKALFRVCHAFALLMYAVVVVVVVCEALCNRPAMRSFLDYNGYGLMMKNRACIWQGKVCAYIRACLVSEH
jgi:hypothetical protein